MSVWCQTLTNGLNSRLAEEENGKNELWRLVYFGCRNWVGSYPHVLTALGFLYGARVREEVHGGLRWLLGDRESLSQIGLTSEPA
jgi:hypothetical protein